jgi:hypothetical protein
MRWVGSVLSSRFTIGIICLLIVLPMLLADIEVSSKLFSKPDIREEMDICTGIGVIMIGLGVALEERKTLREVFGLLGGPDEAWQASIDHLCHNYGAGQLVIGLLAEICIEAIKIPNTILYTGEVDDYLVAASLFFVLLGAILLFRFGFTLIFLMGKDRAHRA